jgi:hypothetical protein
MSVKEELPISDIPESNQIASEDQKLSQFNSHNAPEKLGSSPGTPVSPEEQNEFVSRPPAFERRLLRKIDWHIVPSIALLYWLLNLSESQLGKAKIFGLVTDLHLTGVDFNIAAVAFSVPHIIFAIPSNLILKHVKPRIWLSSISY